MGPGGRRPDTQQQQRTEQLEDASTVPAGVAEDILSEQRTLRADEVRAIEAASPQAPSSTPSVVPTPLRSAVPPPPASDPGAFTEPSPWRSSFGSFEDLRQGSGDRIARFIAERPGLVIGGASAIAGALLAGAVIVFVVASGPAPTAPAQGASARATAAASTTGAAMPSATTASAAAAGTPAPFADEPPLDDATPAQVAVSANAPIARIRIGKRVVDMEVPAPSIAVDLTPDEASRRISVSVTSTDGRIASGMWAPGDPQLALEFGDAPAARSPGKAGGKASGKAGSKAGSKARPKAPRH